MGVMSIWEMHGWGGVDCISRIPRFKVHDSKTTSRRRKKKKKTRYTKVTSPGQMMGKEMPRGTCKIQIQYVDVR